MEKTEEKGSFRVMTARELLDLKIKTLVEIDYKDRTYYLIPFNEERYGKHKYDIEFKRMKTQRDLIGWILHLSEKVWVNTETIHQLIDAYCKVNKTNFYGI